MDLQGKNVAVVGLGTSGLAAAALCKKRGATVSGFDDRAADSIKGDLSVSALKGASFEAFDLVVVSPGIPPLASLAAAVAQGISVIGEVELAVQCLDPKVPYAAVGGTNGKSTTTSLLGAMLREDGKRVFVGGNLGEPLAAHVDEAWDVVILEVSSFQMERVDTFHPTAALLLNITPDHLDRYDGFEAYAAAKGNAFLRQTAADIAIVPTGDGVCAAQAKRGQGKLVTFGLAGDVMFVEPENCLVDLRDKQTYSLADFKLVGVHNVMNAAAAVIAARHFGCSPEAIRRTLATFVALSHRIELVGEANGVRFYDDSKATNVDSAVIAVDGFADKRVILIAGGKDKGGSYVPLAEALARRNNAEVVVIGEAAELIASAVGSIPDRIPVHRATSMDDAVAQAAKLARPGDAVLLSPACSSFDMFRDYKERGEVFARAAKALADQSTS
jgi:UDP-N-acetylmuramoylalanine--D-glutamate ligase